MSTSPPPRPTASSRDLPRSVLTATTPGGRRTKTADERTVRPEEMARMCGIRVPKQDKAFSWHQFCELLGDAYDTARRQRQQGDTGA